MRLTNPPVPLAQLLNSAIVKSLRTIGSLRLKLQSMSSLLVCGEERVNGLRRLRYVPGYNLLIRPPVSPGLGLAGLGWLGWCQLFSNYITSPSWLTRHGPGDTGGKAPHQCLHYLHYLQYLHYLHYLLLTLTLCIFTATCLVLHCHFLPGCRDTVVPVSVRTLRSGVEQRCSAQIRKPRLRCRIEQHFSAQIQNRAEMLSCRC